MKELYFKFKKLLILDIIIAILFAFIQLAIPLVTRQVTNEVIPSQDINQLIVLAVVLVITVILYALLLFLQTWIGHVYGSKIENQVRVNAFNKLQSLSFDFFDKNKVGQILSKVTTDANYISEMMHHFMEDMISLVIVLGFGLFFMFQINVYLTITFLILIIIQIAGAYLTTFKLSDAFVKLREKNGELISNAETGVTSIRLTRAFTNEEHEKSNFNNTANWYFNAQVVAYKILGIVSSLNSLFLDIQTIAFIIVGGYLVIVGNLSYGDWITFYIFLGIITQPVRRVLNLYESYLQGFSSFRRYKSIMDEPITIVDKENAKPLASNLSGKINFVDVSFEYSDGTKVFSHLNLDLQPGKVTALVGESGIGKSTLIQLIPRFYNLSDGKILIDNQDITDIKINDLRNKIGFVEQNVTIFNATIRDNILYGKLDATDEEIEMAIKNAALEDLIESLPNGLNTVVGEKGSFLSGGQKQRVSLARIFLKNPPIIILDEATSALDTITERYVQEQIEKLSKGRTVIIVAHRLSTIQSADEIIVLGDNKILQRGNHEQLINQDGHYKRLYLANKQGII